MHLVSCEHPQRIFNKYLNDYIWVPCGKCNTCRNSRAFKYTQLLERERLQHRFSFFVTLTYDNQHIPYLSTGVYFIRTNYEDCEYYGSRERDSICIPYQDFFPVDKSYDYTQADKDFLTDWLKFGGLPYASKTDVQLFLKRLNKYIHDNITHKFKNFRYFIVSEYGSTTFRPHFHAIFYIDNDRVADKFNECISSCWRFGNIDCQFVEDKACAYVAQYINKSADLPYVYQNRQISPFFLCSRNPYIGTMSECSENDAEIINKCAVEISVRGKARDSKFVNVPLLESYQNRLFPKCPCYGSVTDFVRTELYTASKRFSIKTFKSFVNDVFTFITDDVSYPSKMCEFAEFLRSQLTFSDTSVIGNPADFTDVVSLFDKYSYNWLRRWYYLVKKVEKQAFQYGLTLKCYIQKIYEYYDKKKLYYLNKFYEFQEKISKINPECLCLLYPEYLFQNGIFNLSSYAKEMDFRLALDEIDTSAFYAYQNKKTHYKNGYIDSLKQKRDTLHLFNIIKKYFNGKKCNEALEALAA